MAPVRGNPPACLPANRLAQPTLPSARTYSCSSPNSPPPFPPSFALTVSRFFLQNYYNTFFTLVIFALLDASSRCSYFYIPAFFFFFQKKNQPTMKFSAAFLAFGLVAAVAAQSSTQSAASPQPTSEQQKCVTACKSDVDCAAKCLGNPAYVCPPPWDSPS